MAAVELEQDIRRTLRATYRTVASPPPDMFLMSNESFLSAWDSVEKVRGSFDNSSKLTASDILHPRSPLFPFSHHERKIISLLSIVLMVSAIVSDLDDHHQVYYSNPLLPPISSIPFLFRPSMSRLTTYYYI